MIEFSFALPLSPVLLHPETGEPLIYTARADRIATYAAGAVSIYDDKTTSSLGASWAGQWDRRSQFTGYAWAARAFGIPVAQSSRPGNLHPQNPDQPRPSRHGEIPPPR